MILGAGTMKDQVKLLIDLRGLRKEAGMPVNTAVELSGVCKSIYERIETGGLPNLPNALKFARFLQMPVDEIWGLIETRKD